jgi:hypothetical protein
MNVADAPGWPRVSGLWALSHPVIRRRHGRARCGCVDSKTPVLAPATEAGAEHAAQRHAPDDPSSYVLLPR